MSRESKERGARLKAARKAAGLKQSDVAQELLRSERYPFYELQQILLDSYRADDWDCASDGAIRDAFGRDIGTRWVCTKCT